MDEPSIYDHPEWFDLLFADETKPEADFIEAACNRYATGRVQRMLEPGCGGGRLILELARRGYRLTGFDQSTAALYFLKRQLSRRGLKAQLFEGDLARFRIARPVDAAFCTFNTFRHLLTEDDARSHLQCVAQALRPGAIYILGFHLLPLDVDEECTERWRAQQGKLRVTGTLRVLSANRRQRLEQIRLSLLVRKGGQETRLRTEFPLRMYTAAQFRTLLRSVKQFELCDVFDFWYDIESPLRLDNEITDSVFVLRKRS